MRPQLVATVPARDHMIGPCLEPYLLRRGPGGREGGVPGGPTRRGRQVVMSYVDDRVLGRAQGRGSRRHRPRRRRSATMVVPARAFRRLISSRPVRQVCRTSRERPCRCSRPSVRALAGRLRRAAARQCTLPSTAPSRPMAQTARSQLANGQAQRAELGRRASPVATRHAPSHPREPGSALAAHGPTRGRAIPAESWPMPATGHEAKKDLARGPPPATAWPAGNRGRRAEERAQTHTHLGGAAADGGESSQKPRGDDSSLGQPRRACEPCVALVPRRAARVRIAQSIGFCSACSRDPGRCSLPAADHRERERKEATLGPFWAWRLVANVLGPVRVQAVMPRDSSAATCTAHTQYIGHAALAWLARIGRGEKTARPRPNTAYRMRTRRMTARNTAASLGSLPYVKRAGLGDGRFRGGQGALGRRERRTEDAA